MEAQVETVEGYHSIIISMNNLELVLVFIRRGVSVCALRLAGEFWRGN